MKLYNTMKQMLPVAESCGNITDVCSSENWIGKYDRVKITGTTYDGRKFEMTLEIEVKEENNDAEELE